MKSPKASIITALVLILGAFMTIPEALACTSMLVSAKASATGRPLMWKHRDTDAPSNFIERVAPTDGRHGYVALFNEGDSLLLDAWMGFNDAGFAIMNTASYNLAPDTAEYKDQEGRLMSIALQRCSTVADFATLLDTLPKPMGVQANFGVMDANGNLAYFETDDYRYVRYDVADAPEGYIVRTNHSLSGNDTDGFGYIRFQSACDILADEMATGTLSPQAFTEKASRSFWHSLIGKDFLAGDDAWAVDQDFIPRYISTASVVIEGVNPGEAPYGDRMWAMLGYPPCSWVESVTLDNVPDCVRPIDPGWTAPNANASMQMKAQAFPLTVGNGKRYVDLRYLRAVMPALTQKSIDNYNKYQK